MLKTHYRQPMDFSKAGLGTAWRELDKFYAAIRAADLGDEEDNAPAQSLPKLPPEFHEAICDDLNTALAIRHLHDYAKSAQHGDKSAALALRHAGGVMGILTSKLQNWFALSGQDKDATRPAEELALIAQLQQQREDARRARNFAEADRLRDALFALGVKSQDQALKK